MNPMTLPIAPLPPKMKTKKPRARKVKRVSIHKLSPCSGDITGKTVKLYDSWFIPGLNPDENLFTCSGGFGCSGRAIGQAVFGKFSDGECARISRSDIEGIVTSEKS